MVSARSALAHDRARAALCASSSARRAVPCSLIAQPPTVADTDATTGYTPQSCLCSGSISAFATGDGHDAGPRNPPAKHDQAASIRAAGALTAGDAGDGMGPLRHEEAEVPHDCSRQPCGAVVTRRLLDGRPRTLLSDLLVRPCRAPGEAGQGDLCSVRDPAGMPRLRPQCRLDPGGMGRNNGT